MYRQGLTLAPNDVAANQNYSLLLMEQGSFRQALGPLLRLRKLNDSDVATRATLIECYSKAGMPADAKLEIQEFETSSAATTENKLKLAKLLLDDKAPNLAQPMLARVVQENPDSVEAHASLGKLLMNQGRYREASDEFRAAARLSPTSPEYAMHTAECLILAQRYPDALEFLKSVKGRFSGLTEYRFKMGIALYGDRQYTQAVALLDALDEEQPNLDLIQYYLANCYNEMEEIEKAQAYAEKAVAINPHQASNYVVLAKVLKKRGATDQAIANLQRALSLDPSNTLAKHELASCYEEKHDYADAERLLKELVVKAPDVVQGSPGSSGMWEKPKI